MFKATGSQTLPLAFSKEVLKALREKTPIVALESLSIVKSNSKLMLDMETLVRDLGATPATIG
jgi:pseudouridine-5'-phosphate glycosidase